MRVAGLPHAKESAAAGDPEQWYRTARALEAQGRIGPVAGLLRRAADAGHVEALTYLGLKLASGRGVRPDPAEAAALLARAAERGGSVAAETCAAMAAHGVGLPQDWTVALDYLAWAALGQWRARAQLALLTSDRDAASAIEAGQVDAEILRRARAGIDVEDWITAPPGRPVRRSPRLWARSGFLPARICAWLMERARGQVVPAAVYDPITGASSHNSTRTNSTTEFDLVQSDLVLALVRARMADAVGVPPRQLERTAVLHYSPGQRFVTHTDYLDPATAALAAELAQRGQRSHTVLVYLNDGYRDGETFFPELALKWRGAAGDALVFANLDPTGAPDPNSRHAGLPPSKGEKWLLSQWVRDRPQVEGLRLARETGTN